MIISEVIEHLDEIRHEHGDIEIYEALPEYGQIVITEDSIRKLIRFEKVKTKTISFELLVIGRH